MENCHIKPTSLHNQSIGNYSSPNTETLELRARYLHDNVRQVNGMDENDRSGLRDIFNFWISILII